MVFFESRSSFFSNPGEPVFLHSYARDFSYEQVLLS